MVLFDIRKGTAVTEFVLPFHRNILFLGSIFIIVTNDAQTTFLFCKLGATKPLIETVSLGPKPLIDSPVSLG